jgi:plastocyanin
MTNHRRSHLLARFDASLALLCLALLPALAHATQEVVVAQKNKAFSTATLAIHVGDKVTFRNDDAFVHNVFSLTDAMPFDLGTAPQGQAKSIAFTKAGKFEIECAIHPEMKLIVTVAP